MLVEFVQDFGSHQKGKKIELPDDLAKNFVNVGVAKKSGEVIPSRLEKVSKTKVYKSDPLSKLVRK